MATVCPAHGLSRWWSDCPLSREQSRYQESRLGNRARLQFHPQRTELVDALSRRRGDWMVEWVQRLCRIHVVDCFLQQRICCKTWSASSTHNTLSNSPSFNIRHGFGRKDGTESAAVMLLYWTYVRPPSLEISGRCNEEDSRRRSIFSDEVGVCWP